MFRLRHPFRYSKGVENGNVYEYPAKLQKFEPRKHLSNDIVVKCRDFQQFSEKMLTSAKIVMS